jgi:hypothetical protein
VLERNWVGATKKKRDEKWAHGGYWPLCAPKKNPESATNEKTKAK